MLVHTEYYVTYSSNGGRSIKTNKFYDHKTAVGRHLIAY